MTSLRRVLKRMKRGVPGVTVTCSLWREKVLAQAFVPSALPPNPPVRIEGPLARKFDETMLLLGHLNATYENSPIAPAVQHLLLRREAVFSLAATGRSAEARVLLRQEAGHPAEASPSSHVVAVHKGVLALEPARSQLDRLAPYSAGLLNEVQRLLAGTGRSRSTPNVSLNDTPGQFRTKQAWPDVLRPRRRPNMYTPARLVPETMRALEVFTQLGRAAAPGLIGAGLAHCQMELIHPYADEVGRTARVASLHLLRGCKLLRGVLTLSRYFATNRHTHHQALDAVRYDGDWEVWLGFYLEAVAQGAIDAQTVFDQLRDSVEANHERLKARGREGKTAMYVISAMVGRPCSSAQALAKVTGATVTTVNKALGYSPKSESSLNARASSATGFASMRK